MPSRRRSGGITARPAERASAAVRMVRPATATTPSMRRKVAGATPASTSTISVWPFPSTPATTTIAPADTRSDTRSRTSAPRRSRAETSASCRTRSGVGERLRLTRRRATRLRRGVHHQRRERRLVVRGCRPIAHDPALPQHRDPVGQRQRLGQLVRHDDDRRAGRGQLAQQDEQLLHLVGGEDGGRLVEDQEPRRRDQRLQDLDALLLAHREVLDQRGADPRSRAAARRASARDLAGQALGAERTEVAARERHVLRDRHRRHQHEVLVDHRDAGTARFLRRAPRDRSAGQPDLAGVRDVESRHHLHERGLARAVLAEQRVNGPGVAAEVDPVERLHRTEALARRRRPRAPARSNRRSGRAGRIARDDPGTRRLGRRDLALELRVERAIEDLAKARTRAMAERDQVAAAQQRLGQRLRARAARPASRGRTRTRSGRPTPTGCRCGSARAGRRSAAGRGSASGSRPACSPPARDAGGSRPATTPARRSRGCGAAARRSRPPPPHPARSARRT